MSQRSSRFSVNWLLVVGIIVMLNLLSARFYTRFDWSENKQFTLSSATKGILRDLPEPVTVRAYFSEDLPPDFLRARNQFKEMLVEYAALTRGNLVYEFINPNESEELEKEASEKGLPPVMIEVREKDRKKQMRAYLGATVEMGEEMEVIPFIPPDGSMEYALSSAIRKLAVQEKPTLGFIQGHGEPELPELAQVMAEMSVLYDVQPYWIAGGTVPSVDRYPAMLWVNPVDTIPQWHFDFLDDYISNGGRLLVAFNPVKGDFVEFLATPAENGMKEWLRNYGIVVERNLVVDNRCGALTLQQTQGFFTYASNVPFPYLPLMQGISGNPISGGLDAVMFQFPSELKYEGDTTFIFEPVLHTSAQAHALPLPQVLDVQRQWTLADYKREHITVAASLTGALRGEFTRMVVMTDGDFAVNGPRDQARQLQPDNINFFVNAVDWLLDDDGLVQLRNRLVQSRPIEAMEDGTRTTLKFLNFLLPVAIVLIIGLIRFQQRRSLRKKRMQADYSNS
ncbi:MAG: hypothetical protein EA392_02730 [Cryomorphaceae bacterium]|nr:MAG: hypothetical protein EA392_02730 [Cryomorphaceae bacterium]